MINYRIFRAFVKQKRQKKGGAMPIKTCPLPWPNTTCTEGEKIMANSVVSLAGDQVLAIAQTDAARVYRDLSPYRIQLVLEDDGWHVDYQLKDSRLKGGGPHYLIDAQTGAIVSKRYEQ
jgi:hypothetical protein